MGATPRSFRKRDKNKHYKSVTFKDAKKIAMNAKDNNKRRRQRRKQSDDDSSGSSEYTGSETESGSTDDSEYTSTSGSDSEYETGSDSEYEDDSEYTSSGDTDSDYSEYTTTESGDSIKNAAIKHILEDKKSMFSGDDNDDEDDEEDYDWNHKKEKKQKSEEQEAKKKKQKEEEKRLKLKEKQQQLEKERIAKENELKQKQQKEKKEEKEQEYDDEEDEEYEDSEDESSENEQEDDTESDDEDDEEERIDAGMQAYVQLNSSDTAALMEGDEHKEWTRLQQLKDRGGNHRRGSTEFWKWNTPQLIAEENDDQTADDKELAKMWIKLKNIPKSSKKDTTQTRIVKEFMMFQLNHDHSIADSCIIIESMAYPNIYEWNGCFVGPKGTPYVNGKYKILINFSRDYPDKQPKITFLTKIYNSSVRHNKRKKRGLLRLPKFFDKIWSNKLSLRSWLNVVYEFIFYYAGDNFFDPMTPRVAREFKSAFDSFIDTAYQWNLIFAAGYDAKQNMMALHDEYGERQKLTFHSAKYSNQYDVDQYKYIKEVIWQTIREKYRASYELFSVLLDYFGNEFYYCSLSELIREPHVCVAHKVKRYENIIQW